MTLKDIYQLVDELSSEEFAALSDYMRQQSELRRVSQYTPEQRFQMIDEGFAQLREGLTPEQLKEITDAMNFEYIEPFDEAEWKD